MPKVSVILPVYNNEKYLRQAIESVLNQTFKDFEFLIFDDCSTDKSLSIIKSYKDKRIKVFTSEKNRYSIVHMNKGISIAKGNYIARMDADDISLPNRFEKQVNFLDKNKSIVLVGCFAYEINPEGKITDKIFKPVGPQNIRKTCFYYGPHIQPSIMFRKDIIQKVGLYREQYPLIEDIDLYFRLIFSGYKTDNIPEYLLKYRVHPDSTNKYYKEKNRIGFELKWEIQKKLHLKYTFTEFISIYIHYILGLLFTFEQKTKIEKMIKHLITRII